MTAGRAAGRLVPPLRPTLVGAALVSAAIVTLGAPLVPAVGDHFQVPQERAQWSYTVTLLVGATVTPVLGRLADGHRRRIAMILTCVAVAAGCVLSALARGYGVFLAGRAVQGLAVSLVAMTIAVARDHVPGRPGVRLVALLSITTALGAGVSYPLTTVVAQQFGLSAAYGLSAVLALLVTVAVMVGLPRTVDRGRPRGLDVPGAVLLAGGTAAALLVISQGNSWGWSSRRLLALAAASGVLLAGWVAVELRVRRPLVQLRLLVVRTVLIADLTALLMGVSLYSVPVLVSRMAQAPVGTGYGAGISLGLVGLLMTPIAAGNLVGARLAAAADDRFGPRAALGIGALVAGLGPALLLAGVTGVWGLLVAIGLSAVGAGATFGSMPNLIVASVGPAETGSATSVNILLRAVGGALGSAVTAALLGAHPGAVPGFASDTGVRLACLACAVTCLLAVAASAAMPARAPAPGPVVPAPVA